jgi:hypothetical protein
MSGTLTVSDFRPHVGKLFTPTGRHHALRLVSVDTTKGSRWPGMSREPFTLILHGPSDDVLPEGLYDVTVADGPVFSLYIIPIRTAAGDRQDHQVVFN